MITFRIKKQIREDCKGIKYEVTIKAILCDKAFDHITFEVDKETYENFDTTKMYTVTEYKGKEAK